MGCRSPHQIGLAFSRVRSTWHSEMSNMAQMRKRVNLATFFTFVGALLGLLGWACASFFPDQTWRALSTDRTMYDGFVSRLTPIPSGADRNIQGFSIYESLVRDLVGNRMNEIIFLELAGADPNDELLTRLSASALVGKRASEAHFREGQSTARWTDPATGKPAVMIDIGSIGWVFGNSVEVKGGLGCGPLCRGGGVDQVAKRHERWTVSGSRDRWVS